MAESGYDLWNEGVKIHTTDPQKAIGFYEKALKLTEHVFLYTNIADCYKRLNNLEKCEEWYNIAESKGFLTLESKYSSNPYINYAAYLLEIKNIKKALKYASVAMEIDSSAAYNKETYFKIIEAEAKEIGITTENSNNESNEDEYNNGYESGYKVGYENGYTDGSNNNSYQNNNSVSSSEIDFDSKLINYTSTDINSSIINTYSAGIRFIDEVLTELKSYYDKNQYYINQFDDSDFIFCRFSELNDENRYLYLDYSKLKSILNNFKISLRNDLNDIKPNEQLKNLYEISNQKFVSFNFIFDFVKKTITDFISETERYKKSPGIYQGSAKTYWYSYQKTLKEREEIINYWKIAIIDEKIVESLINELDKELLNFKELYFEIIDNEYNSGSLNPNSKLDLLTAIKNNIVDFYKNQRDKLYYKYQFVENRQGEKEEVKKLLKEIKSK